jgi:hypothetical protein
MEQEEEARGPGGHPFADEQAMWDDLPKIRAADLFS